MSNEEAEASEEMKEESQGRESFMELIKSDIQNIPDAGDLDNIGYMIVHPRGDGESIQRVMEVGYRQGPRILMQKPIDRVLGDQDIEDYSPDYNFFSGEVENIEVGEYLISIDFNSEGSKFLETISEEGLVEPEEIGFLDYDLLNSIPENIEGFSISFLNLRKEAVLPNGVPVETSTVEIAYFGSESEDLSFRIFKKDILDELDGEIQEEGDKEYREGESTGGDRYLATFENDLSFVLVAKDPSVEMLEKFISSFEDRQ